MATAAAAAAVAATSAVKPNVVKMTQRDHLLLFTVGTTVPQENPDWVRL